MGGSLSSLQGIQLAFSKLHQQGRLREWGSPGWFLKDLKSLMYPIKLQPMHLREFVRCIFNNLFAYFILKNLEKWCVRCTGLQGEYVDWHLYSMPQGHSLLNQAEIFSAPSHRSNSHLSLQTRCRKKYWFFTFTAKIVLPHCWAMINKLISQNVYLQIYLFTQLRRQNQI